VDVLFPTSADEAASLYGDGAGITVFAGGTILLPEIAAGRAKPKRALMLHRTGLDTLRVDANRVVIGAMVSIAALLDAPDDVLARVAPYVADREVRQNATVGGNIAAAAGADAQRGDLGAPLIALGARVRSTGAGGERAEPIEEFLAGDRAGRLVLDVEYDRFERRFGTAGLRRRHAHSYAIAGVVACARPDGTDLRIGVSGVAATAVRCRTVEQSRNAADVLADVEPVDDAVASAGYRRTVLPKLVRDALDQLERA
ncbi:MAG: FAD binding domain-containing protein, partial [Actinomycetota bacterium]|nr:FAD binding domain-containing protein [Actinomycetota bacterium]